MSETKCPATGEKIGKQQVKRRLGESAEKAIGEEIDSVLGELQSGGEATE